MKVKCAWCQIDIPGIDSQKVESEFPVSHGVCKDCSKLLLAEMATPLSEFLDTFDVPVMLVDNLNNLMVTNRIAQTTFPVKLGDVDKNKIGQILGCVHSEEPDGCGATVHCQGCVIRKSILSTDLTGKPCREKACDDKQFHLGNRTATMVITTEKLGNRILLKLEPLKNEEKE